MVGGAFRLFYRCGGNRDFRYSVEENKMFAGEPAPFVMELPAYHAPTAVNILRGTWERGWSFIKKAGTVILLASIFVWFTKSFGFVDGSFGMVEDMDASILAAIGSFVAPIFAPLGFGNWQSTVASGPRTGGQGRGSRRVRRTLRSGRRCAGTGGRRRVQRTGPHCPALYCPVRLLFPDL